MLTTLLVAWMLVTLASAVGLLAFLAFDQWQVRSVQARAQAQAQGVVIPVEVQQVA